MNRIKIYSYIAAFMLAGLGWLLADSSSKRDAFSERSKIALREVGNRLLLTNNDSTSLILPVLELDPSEYQVSFQKELSFEPNQLVAIVDSTFVKSGLSRYYRVEVFQCSDKEVAYSYQMNADEESTIIPCGGRYLPEGCYFINTTFTKQVPSFTSRTTFSFILIGILLLFAIDMLYTRYKQKTSERNDHINYTTLGRFQFYPDQNKLIKEAEEISLSKKECELLEIFVKHQNQVIKRDELTKKVWEDNGVFVGRSLDTYISKLRKKLKDDSAIKLINVHGVGYKLEVS